MSSRTNVLLAKIGTVAFKGAQRAFERRDIVAAERLGEKFARVGFRLDRKHRERAIANIKLAFPEKSDEEARQLALGVFLHFGRVLADFLRSPARSDEEVLASVEEVDLTPYYEANAKGKGVLAVTGHMGNWERLAHWYQAHGWKMSVVARDANDEGLQQQIAKIRGGSGLSMLSRGNSARAILEKLRNKETIGILPDQNSEEAFLPFFGKPCGTVLGPAVLHLRTGAPVVCGFCLRVGPGKYRIEVFEPIQYARGEATPEQVMTDVNAVIEKVIRKYPDQWLWLHDRWKSARKAGLL
ncbi:MAG: Kdo2-lipid lauroyltransferase/acyltransferase [Fimbriimonadaceae bacterium]|jgi:KDO2-lipid IV(A) lauroyltransferase|nr:Kdo2-lipid lauroyltransferase/acyltransferase [Fimbriimonadaceae bacterium]